MNKYFKISLYIVLGIIAWELLKSLLQVSTDDYIKKEIGVDISSCSILIDNDTHGGLLGDGDYFAKAKCSDDFIKQLDSWQELPLSRNLDLIMYGGYKDRAYYSYELALDMGIPEIKNGYYLFIDRSDEATDIHSDEDLFDRYSFNFTIVLYDTDTNYFYYYEFDT